MRDPRTGTLPDGAGRCEATHPHDASQRCVRDAHGDTWHHLGGVGGRSWRGWHLCTMCPLCPVCKDRDGLRAELGLPPSGDPCPACTPAATVPAST